MSESTRRGLADRAEGHERGEVYRRLGVEPIINGAATLTVLGGSLMPSEVLEAMRLAAETFVDMLELQGAVSRRVAELTHNEGAFVSGGAAAGLVLSAAVAMARNTGDGIWRRELLAEMPRQILIHRVHRIPYDPAVELAGATLVEIGAQSGTFKGDLERMIDRNTAAVLFVAGAHLADGALPLESVVEVAHAQGVPVIVDAAAQLPPRDNLWRFTEQGADISIFSGGKGICGPASTGIVVGRARYLKAFPANAAPLHRIGRPMKVSKEDLVGILYALEWYLRIDQEALMTRYDLVVAHFVEWAAKRNDVFVDRSFPSEAGQPMPRARVRIAASLAGRRDEVLSMLRATRPRIDLLPDGSDGLFVNPQTLVTGDEEIISRRLGEILDQLSHAQ